MIPTIQEIESRMIGIINRAKTISTQQLIQDLKKEFKLTTVDLECKTACGRQYKFDNRVIYVRTKLCRENIIYLDSKKVIKHNEKK